MAYNSVKEAMTALGDAIRNYLGIEWQRPLKIEEMVSLVPEVHNVGKSDGAEEEYNRFWDSFQGNGASRAESGTFAGSGWTDATFKPKYDLQPTNANQMFWSSAIGNIVQCLEDAGVTADFSKSGNMTATFSYSKTTHVPFVDMSAAKTNTNNVFASASKLQWIEGIKVISTNTSLSNIFSSCSALTHVVFSADSQINSNLNLSAAKGLDEESIRSIFAALHSSTTARTLTLSTDAVNGAFTSESGATGEATGEWAELIAAKPSNWTVTLV